jgi:hypothetical protein
MLHSWDFSTCMTSGTQASFQKLPSLHYSGVLCSVQSSAQKCASSVSSVKRMMQHLPRAKTLQSPRKPNISGLKMRVQGKAVRYSFHLGKGPQRRAAILCAKRLFFTRKHLEMFSSSPGTLLCPGTVKCPRSARLRKATFSNLLRRAKIIHLGAKRHFCTMQSVQMTTSPKTTNTEVLYPHPWSPHRNRRRRPAPRGGFIFVRQRWRDGAGARSAYSDGQLSKWHKRCNI